jgi:N5-(cytidine 5'-diphosphoramidyl)-L-glutamine hydrolase
LKKILISQRLIANSSYYEVRECLDINWCKYLQYNGYIPIVLPLHVDPDLYFSHFNIDGVILTGGNSLNNVDPNELSSQRDQVELKLIESSIKKKIPLFGVCRGMQILAKFFSSDLIKIDGHTATRHKLNCSLDSKYFKIINQYNSVNSYHDYAIREIADDFIIAATSSDGTIEAIEHKELKVFGQMWHCERESPFCKTDCELLNLIFKG